MNKTVLLLLFTSLIYWGCKKEEPSKYIPDFVAPKWECVSAADVFEDIVVMDSAIYLIGLENNYKLDSGSISSLGSSGYYRRFANVNVRSKFSGKYIAQYKDYDHNHNCIDVYKLLDPSVITHIYLDSLTEFPGELKCWGEFNNEHELMISTHKGTVLKFSFSDDSSGIAYTTEAVIIDTIIPYYDIYKICSSGSEFYINSGASMYRYSNGSLTDFPETNIWEMGTFNDTIYANVYGGNLYSTGLIASVDHGQTWQQVVSNFTTNHYIYSYTANKILLNYNFEIKQVQYDWNTSQSHIKVFNRNEEDNIFWSGYEIYRFLIFKEYIYASTGHGLYRRKVSELNLL